MPIWLRYLNRNLQGEARDSFDRAVECEYNDGAPDR